MAITKVCTLVLELGLAGELAEALGALEVAGGGRGRLLEVVRLAPHLVDAAVG